MSCQLELENIQVKYGNFTAVQDVSLNLEKGQIGCLLGPSGCGKTTLLRAIAGFESITEGEIKINGQVISSTGRMTPPELRNVGMVFQDFALFPHLNIDRNVGFGLSGKNPGERSGRVAELLELVGLADYAKAYPHELSGGQQQRVALARAMAPSPDVLLLDEPFSSLDSELREQLAGEVRQILTQHNITAVLVTHDQHEAFAMADQITLLQNGRVAQAGTASDLYHNPANEFVAGFIGQGVIINVTVNDCGELSSGLGTLDAIHRSRSSEGALRLLVRPDAVKYAPDSPLSLTVTGKSFRGAQYIYELELEDGQRLGCMTPSQVDVAIGAKLPVLFELDQAVYFEPS